MSEHLPYKVKKNKPIPEDPRKAPSKKDTKHWCKGKIGREHKLAWIDHPGFMLTEWQRDHNIEPLKLKRCSTCGKHFDVCWNSTWRNNSNCICGLHRRFSLGE